MPAGQGSAPDRAERVAQHPGGPPAAEPDLGIMQDNGKLGYPFLVTLVPDPAGQAAAGPAN
jgi:hypothetical protein